MDIEAIMKLVNDTRKSQSNNLTIGEAINELQRLPEQAMIRIDSSTFNDDKGTYSSDPDYTYWEDTFANGAYFDNTFGSYRGYYEDMYVGITETQADFTVRQLNELLHEALSKRVMYGYKGGGFSINSDTILWLSKYSDTGGIAPIKFYKMNDNEVLLITKLVN